MKSSKVVVAVLILILSTVFAMSGDGGQQPAKPEKKTEVTQTQNEQAQQAPSDEKEGSDKRVKYAQKECPLLVRTEQIDSKGMVTDKLGYYTGMTKDELQKFKEDYNKLDKKMFPNTRTTMLYDAKVDLNRYEELKKLGVDLKRSGAPTEAKFYKENAIYRDIVVIGKTIGPEKVTGANTFKIEIIEVLKGAEILKYKLGEVPKYFNYFDPFTPEPIIGKIGMYFWGFAEDIDINNRRFIQQVTGSTLIMLNDTTVIYERLSEYVHRKPFSPGGKSPAFVYSDDFKKRLSWDEVVQNVRDILKVNDTENFYKKIFKVRSAE